MLALSARSGRIAARIGPRLQMSVGPVVVGVGMVLLARIPAGTSYLTGTFPAVVVLALGLAATVAPLTATALNSVSDVHAGMASAVNNDVARLGSLIAVAVLPALGGITGSSYLHPHALAHGFERAVVIAGSWCVVGGVVAALGIRNPVRAPRPATGDPGVRYCALEASPLRPPT
jgi:MFS family permease